MKNEFYIIGLLLCLLCSSNIYSQCISGDCQNGKGTMIYSNGSRYEGNWSNGKCSGFGIESFPNGSRYEGHFVDNNYNGKGIGFLANGDRYEGNYVDGYRSGYGTLFYKDGIKYEGNWSQSKCNGFGIQTWPKGDRYEGNWLNNKRNGKGKAFWANGDRYEGDFVDDYRTGFGKLLKKDGTIQEGRFLNDVFQGSEAASSNTKVNTQSSNTPVSSLPDGDIIWKHNNGSFEIKGKEGDQTIWQEDGGSFIYLEQEWQTDGTKEGSGPILKRKNENVYIRLTFNKCYYKDNSNPNWALLYNGGFYSKTLARYLVVDDFNKSSQSTSTTASTSNVSANKTVSNYKFTPPPALKITYTDNRKMCCCCNEKYAQYELEDKKKLEVTEKINYCTEKLALFHKENGNGPRSSTINPEQIELDLKKLQDELLKLYPNDGLEIGFRSRMWYNVAAMGFMKLCSTERNVDLYRNIGNHCSLKCKNICGSCR